jgi:signal transduction histidine kinase
MKVLGRTIGALNCSSKEENFYDVKTIRRVRIVADVLDPYFYALRASDTARKDAIFRTEMQAREEGLRLGALSLTEALEQERQRIGMDLHDQTLADLTRIARELGSKPSDVDIERLQLRIQDCIQGLRDIIDTSMPSLLELFGFQHAVRTHLERALATAPLTRFQVIDETDNSIDKLDDSTRIALFRISQEAINNAVHHSGASLIEVEIKSNENAGLQLVVRDNGHWSSANERPKSNGGVTHMQIRARLISAEFEIIRQEGTQISIRVPDPDRATRTQTR